MRKSQTIQIIGIGTFSRYPISFEKEEYNKVNSDGIILKKKIIEPSKRGKYVYVDDSGKEYQEQEVFTDFHGIKIQQIDRTKEVEPSDYSIVDVSEINNLTESQKEFLEVDETTRRIFNEKVGDKAISYQLHKSSIGTEFYQAFIFKDGDLFIEVVGLGDFQKAKQKFTTLLENREHKENEVVIQKVKVNPSEILKLMRGKNAVSV